MKKILSLLLLVILSLSCCSAFAEDLPKPGDTVKSLADYSFRHPFEKGFMGHCIAYMSPDAELNEEYVVVSPAGLYNNSNIEVKSFYNYLKVYATQFSDHFLNAIDVEAQHHVWYFSNNRNGWRLEYDLINEIKNTAAAMPIPDHYIQRLTITDPENQQTKQIDRTWDFMILANKVDLTVNRPIFFAYKYTDTPVEENPGNPPGSSEEIPDNPSVSSENVPQTGDSANLVFWFGMLVISAIAMMFLGCRAKKEY